MSVGAAALKHADMCLPHNSTFKLARRRVNQSNYIYILGNLYSGNIISKNRKDGGRKSRGK